MEPETQNNEVNMEGMVDNINEEETKKETDEGQEVNSEEKTSEKFSEYRNLAMLGYILPFLFFLPLMDEKTKKVPYVRFHAGQQLNLLILIIAIYFVSNILYGVFYMSVLFLMIISQVIQLVYLGLVILVVIGAIHAYKGEMEELPLIGKFKLLK